MSDVREVTILKYRADLLLEIFDSLLKTVPFLEIVLTVVRCGGVVHVGDAAPWNKVGKCLVLSTRRSTRRSSRNRSRTVRPGLAGNRRRDPGISKLQLLTLSRQS